MKISLFTHRETDQKLKVPHIGEKTGREEQPPMTFNLQWHVLLLVFTFAVFSQNVRVYK